MSRALDTQPLADVLPAARPAPAARRIRLGMARNVRKVGTGAGEFDEARAAFFEIVFSVGDEHAFRSAAELDGFAREAKLFRQADGLRATGGKKFGRLGHVATV